jgi:prepilin-type processing-associated H-X9-DG protein
MTMAIICEQGSLPITRKWAGRWRTSPGATRPGTSLIEVVLVCAICSILMGILIPAVMRARDAAARSSCASRLRELSIAVHQYAGQNSHLPAGCDYSISLTGISWQTNILPYLEQSSLFDKAWQANVDDPSGDSAENREVLATVVKVLICPSDARVQGGYGNGWIWGITSYQGVPGTSLLAANGIFLLRRGVSFAEITDGTSNTIMIGERPAGPNGLYGSWYANWGACTCPISQLLPAGSGSLNYAGTDCIPGSSFRQGSLNDGCSTGYYWSLHSGGANFALADASVHFLQYTESDILPMLATRAGGEIVNFDD